MGNPFYNFTLVSTGAPIYIDVNTIDTFYKYLDPKVDEGEVECTIINTTNDGSWAIEEDPEFVYDCISSFIEAEKLGYTP